MILPCEGGGGVIPFHHHWNVVNKTVASFVGGQGGHLSHPPLSSASRWRPTNGSVDMAGPGRVYGASFGPQATNIIHNNHVIAK